MIKAKTMAKLITRSARMASIPTARYSMLQKSVQGTFQTTQLIREKTSGLVAVPARMFSSYPDHLKLEMPNLSPTMEKVS
jgi:hypothetical protein